MNEVVKVIKKRTSLRKFDSRDISKQHLDTIIEGAMRAPTAGNAMYYSILVVKDQETKNILSKTCDNQPFIANAPVVLVFLADVQRWYDYYECCNVKEYCEVNGIKYKGPGKADFLLACNDAIIAAQNAVITAESLGIGSCYIGDVMENYEKHRELLNLPEYTFPICMLTLGYYPEGYETKPRPRFDKKYIVFDEKYRKLNDDELNDMFKEREKKVPKDNKFNAENFGQIFYARKTGSDFMEEMERSINAALKNWGNNKL